MSFRFNFSGDDNVEEENSAEEKIHWLESEEIIPINQIKCLDDMVIRAKMFTCGDVEIGHVVVSEALANMSTDAPNATKLAKDENSDLVTGKYEENSAEEKIHWLESEEIIPINQIKCLDDMVIRAKMFTCGDVEIGHVVVSEALANMSTDAPNATKLAKDENSDLVTGKYEGGLKIWECTYDLLKYLIDNEENQIRESNVLDLGCGAGILGIYAFLNGASVTFQDYNKEVLEYVTIPNVLLNIEDENREKEIMRCKFYSGDWTSFNEKLDDAATFDLILTSETIYNEMNYNKLIQIFTKRLRVNGKVYVAAKTCYFGVGGGVRSFENFINENNNLKCEVCWKNVDGIQREILQITKEQK